MSEERHWVDNAFWVDINKKDAVEAILIIKESKGKEIKQQLVVNETNKWGRPNPDFTQIMQDIGPDKIDENTKRRTIRKKKERELHEERKRSKEQAKELADLFNQKIKMLEIQEIKDSTNRQLKSKLRQSKSAPEAQVYANLLVMEALGYLIEDPKPVRNVKKTPAKRKAPAKKSPAKAKAKT